MLSELSGPSSAAFAAVAAASAAASATVPFAVVAFAPSVV